MLSRPDRDLRTYVVAAVLALVALVASCAALGSLYRYGVDGPVTNSVDFRAFFCGGEALRTGHDPYLVEPMRACQERTLREAGLRGNGRTLPAPLPPYALWCFAAFSLLPIRVATQLWLAASLVAFGLAIGITQRLCGARLPVVTLALAASVGFASLTLGQVVPIVFCAVVAAALRARAGDGRGAACCAAIAALEPHVALPLWCGLLAGLPAARRPLAFAACALVVASLVRHPSLAFEYVTQTLPLHARSELYNFSAQYSAAALAAVLGAGPRVAAVIGTASYAFMLAFGTIVGVRLARRAKDPAFASLVPVTAVLLGGQFLHITQIALAVPLALMLCMRSARGSAVRVAAVLAVIALAIPWEAIAEMPFYWDHHPMSHAVGPPPVLAPPRPHDSLEISYGASIDAYAERIDPRSVFEQFLWKAPSWLALAFILVLALNETRDAGDVRGSRYVRSFRRDETRA